MLVPRLSHSSIVLDGKIYVIGGIISSDALASKTLQIYDPVQDSWTFKADMIKIRAQFPTNVFNGKILAFGGGNSFYYNPQKSIEEYDPITDTWTHKTDMPRARMGHTASLVDGKIYIIGGADADENPLAKVDVYDPVTNTWDTTKADLPTPRFHLSAVVLNSKIYAIGGNQKPYNGFNTVEEYDPATDTWTTKADMMWERKRPAACVLNGKIYVFGGVRHSCANIESSVEEYDPATDTWTERPNMPEKICWHSVNLVNGKFYISGGTHVVCPASAVSTMYEYNPHNDLLPLVEKTEVAKGYVKPAIDSICITTKMRDTTGIKLLAEIEAPDQTPVDSLQLFDDGNHNDGNAGDSIYANVWPVSSSEEQQYYVDLKVTRIDTDTVIHHINNMATFTTIGPITFNDYTLTGSDTEPNPGDRIRLYLSLKNNSTVATATNLGARLISLDTLATVETTASRSFGDIAAGEYSKSSGIYSIKIAEECPFNTPISILAEITSDGYKFWSDTFYILVQEPTSLEDIREPLTRIYPNPTDDMLNIEISDAGNQGLEIEILDITGTLIYQKQFTSSGAHFNEQLDISGYAKGIYLIKVRHAYTIYIGRVVVK